VLCDADGNDLGLRPPLGGGVEKKQVELTSSNLPNLFDPAKMALAWRVLNWAEDYAHDTSTKLHLGWMGFLPESLFQMKPADAQRAWLDKILELAIEAGMVTAVTQQEER
jgi:hypothetical protein